MRPIVTVVVLWERAALDGTVDGVRFGWDDPEHGPSEHWVESDMPFDVGEIDAMRRLIQDRVNVLPFP